MSKAEVGGRFWRVEAPVLGERSGAGAPKIVEGGMFPHQQRWWDLNNFVRLLVSGYGGGKTNVLCKRMISLALENAPAPVAVVSPTHRMGKETTVLTLAELLGGKQSLLRRIDPLHPLWWKFNKQDSQFIVRYRRRAGRIICLSGEDPDKLKGPNLGAAGIDEPFIQDQGVFEQMVARIRHPKAKRLELNLTGTPEHLNWGYDLAEGELGERYDVGVVRASTRDNLALRPQYAEGLLAGYDDKTARAYVFGEFVNLAAGQVYYAFSDANIDGERDVIPEGAELGVGMDFNVNPMAATVFYRWRDHIHFLEEIELPNADTEEMCAALKDGWRDEKGEHPGYWQDPRNPDRPGLRCVYPDATGSSRHPSTSGGRSSFNIIEEAGFEIAVARTKNGLPENPLRPDRYNAVNGKLKSATDRPTTLTISPRCKKLRKYLLAYSHELMNKETQKAMSHLLDAFSYPVAYLFPKDRQHMRELRIMGV